jgi:hypothetical protein
MGEPRTPDTPDAMEALLIDEITQVVATLGLDPLAPSRMFSLARGLGRGARPASGPARTARAPVPPAGDSPRPRAPRGSHAIAAAISHAFVSLVPRRRAVLKGGSDEQDY